MKTTFLKSSPAILFFVLSAALFAGHFATASDKPTLAVAISLDIPPYVVDGAASGLEVDIVSRALEGFDLRFEQMSYGSLRTAVPEKRADVSVGVQKIDDGAFYSMDFIDFANYAISKKSDGYTIESVSDLASRRVLTWQNAYMDLGGEFAELFGPGSARHGDYVEVADQEEQVRRFWEGQGDVVVIDRVIFVHFSKAMGHSMDEAVFHAVFPPVTDFKIAFVDPAVRDRFNEGLARMCRDGDYARLLEKYDVELPTNVCDRLDAK